MNFVYKDLKPPSLIFLLMATMVGIFATNLYVPSFAGIASDLSVTQQSVQLTLTVFLLCFGLFQLVHGPLSDWYGRRRVMLIGLIIFSLGSLSAGFSTSIDWLMAMRVIQALGGSGGMVLARAMVRDVYNRKDSARVMSYVGMGAGVSATAAPLIGGILQDLTGDWRISFFFLSAVAIIPLLVVVFFVDETRSPSKNTENGIVKMLEGYRSLMTSKFYMLFSMGTALMNGCFFSFFAAAPFILVNSLGVSASRLGVILAFVTGGFLLGNLLASRASAVFKLEKIVFVGALVCFSGVTAFFVLAITGHRSELAMSLPLMVFGLGSGCVTPPAGVIAVSVRPDIAGTGSALTGFNSFVIGAVGTLIAGFFLHLDQRPIAIVMLGFVSVSVVCFACGLYLALYRRGSTVF